MKPIKDWEKVQAAGEYEQLPAGGYVVKITDVEDAPEKECLFITYDIAEGKYADHYKDATPELVYAHRFVRSYKTTALGMFKAFTSAVEASNTGYKWDWKEAGLVGRLVGVVLGEEEYENNRGEVRVGLRVVATRSAEAIRQGNFKVPEIKRLPPKSASPVAGFTPFNDADVPF